MKNSLFRVIRKKYAGLLIAMLLVSMLGCGIMSGMSNGFLSLKQTLNEYVSDMKYPDVVIATAITTKDKAELLREIDGVEEVNPRLEGNLVLIDREGRYISTEVMTYGEQDFSKFYYWEKAEEKGEYPILLEHAFCKNNDIHAGDVLTARFGEEERTCTVYGVVSRPETLSSPSIWRMKVTSADICYMFVPESVLEKEKAGYTKAREEWEEKKQEYDEAKDEADSEHEKALKELADAEKELAEKKEEYKKGVEDAAEQKKTLEQNRTEIKTKLQELDELEKNLPAMKEELAKAESTLEQERQKLSVKKAELSSRRAALDQQKRELELNMSWNYGNQAQFDEELRTLQNKYNTLAEYEEEVRTGEQMLNIAYAELVIQRSKISDGERDITSGRKQAEKYLEDIDKGFETIDQGIEDGKKQLEDAERSLKEAREELDTRWADVSEELALGEEELQKAEDKLELLKDCDDLCNQFLIRVSKDSDPAAVQQKAEKALGDLEINDSYTYATSSLRDEIEVENLNPLEIMTMYIPMVFFGVTLIVIFLFMNLLVRRCRREIGILRALGFSKGSIVLQFCMVSLSVSSGAVLAGALMGVIVGRLIGNSFQDFMDLYYLNHQFFWGRLLLAAVITILVGQIATLLSMGYVNRIAPAEAMTRPAPKEAFHAARFMKNSNSFFKYSVFSLLRNKSRFFFAVICLSASTMLMFSAFSFGAAKDKLLVAYYEERVNYDCEAFFSNEPSASTIGHLQKLRLIRSPEIVRYYKKEISFGGVSEETVIQALPKDTDKVRIIDTEENELRLSEDGLILERHFAEKMNLKVGDVVKIDGEDFRLTAISEQYEGRVQLISEEAAERLGEPMSFSILMDVEPDNQAALTQELSKVDGYIFASFVDRNYTYWKNAFLAFTACVVVLIVFAILIGFVIIVNTLRANLLEQKKDLCILRTLGFQCSELSFRLLFQTAPYYVFSCVIGIPAGAFVAKMGLLKMETEGRGYPFVNEPYLYIQTAALVLLYLIVGHIISMRSLKKWDIVESVKDKE